MSFNHNIGYVV